MLTRLRDIVVTMLTSFWGRWASSWILKALTGFLGYDALSSQSTTEKIVTAGSAAITFGVDWILSRLSHKDTNPGEPDEEV